MIFKIVRKSMLKKKGLIFSIFALVILTTLFIGISNLTYDTLSNNNETMMKNTNTEDFRLYSVFLNTVDGQEIIKDVESDQNIVLEPKETLTYAQTDDDGIVTRSYTLERFSEDMEIDKLVVDEGELPVNKDEVIVQPEYLKTTEKEIGDTIDVNGQKYTISGSGYFPEWIYPIDQTGNSISLVPDYNKFVPMFLNEQSFDKINEDDSDYTYQLAYSGQFNDKDLSQKDQDEIYDKITEGYTFEVPILDENGAPQVDENFNVITEEQNYFVVALDVDINPIINGVDQEVDGSKTMFIFLSIILSVLTLFLIIILVNSVFKSQKREIGIMKAEGVSTTKLGLGFISVTAIIVIISMLIGVVLGRFAAFGMLNLYSSIFQIAFYPIPESAWITLFKTVGILLVVMLVLVYYISIRKNLNKKTLNLIKNIDHEKVPKHSFNFITKHLSFMRKYQLNIIIRNFSKSILLAFGVLVSSFLILLGVLMYTGITSMLNSSFTETMTYDYSVVYSNGTFIEQDDNSYIEESLTLKDIDSSNEDATKPEDGDTVTIDAYDYSNNEFIHLTDSEGNELDKTDGITASDGFLKKYGLAINDTITVENPYNLNETVDLKIVESTSDFFVPYIYADLDYLQKEFDLSDSYVNGEYYKGKLSANKRNSILDEDPAAMVTTNADFENAIKDSLNLFIIFIIVIGVLASVIAFISLYSISSIIVDSNRKTISVMKVLGYSDKEVKRMTVGIYKWFVIVIYLVTIPLIEYLIQTVVNQALGDADFTLNINLNYITALFGLALIFIVYLLSERLTYRSIKKIKLAESLKSDE